MKYQNKIPDYVSVWPGDRDKPPWCNMSTISCLHQLSRVNQKNWYINGCKRQHKSWTWKEWFTNILCFITKKIQLGDKTHISSVTLRRGSTQVLPGYPTKAALELCSCYSIITFWLSYNYENTTLMWIGFTPFSTCFMT